MTPAEGCHGEGALHRILIRIILPKRSGTSEHPLKNSWQRLNNAFRGFSVTIGLTELDINLCKPPYCSTIHERLHVLHPYLYTTKATVPAFKPLQGRSCGIT